MAQLNIDVIGRSKKEGDSSAANKDLCRQNEVYVVGSGMLSTDLGTLCARVNKSLFNIGFNYRFDDPETDPLQIFFASDHYSFAEKGIPSVFYYCGGHEDSHKPSDSADKIDYPKMERIVRTIYATALELAEIPERPKVDKKLVYEYTK